MSRAPSSKTVPLAIALLTVAACAAGWTLGCVGAEPGSGTGTGGGNGTGSGGSSSAGTGGTSATTGAGGTSATTGAGGTSATTGAGGTSATTGAGGTSATTGAGGTSATTGAGGATPDAGATGAGGTAGRGGAGGATGAGGVTGTGGTGGVVAATNVFYIGPSGNDANLGTSTAAPFLTISRASNAMKANMGGTIWVMPGTYAYATTQNLNAIGGAGDLMVKLWAMPGTRPVFDFASQPRGSSLDSDLRGFELRGAYWHIRGIDIRNASDNGISITGTRNTVEDVILHGNGDTGIQITASSESAGDPNKASNNLILNCDSYENIDKATGGENADGFAAKLRIGAGNVFRGCRAWSNADDGWDLFAANDIVTIDNCWAFLNGKPPGGNNPSGDGNGFKLGGAPGGADEGGAVHRVTNTAAFENLAYGYTRNNNPSTPSLSGCRVHLNSKGDYSSLTCSGAVNITTTGAAAKTIARDPTTKNLPTIN